MGTELEDIKNRLNIVDVIGGYLKLEKAGTNWRGLCPFHNEKTPSFMVNEDKQFFHCFGCQKGGDIFTFVMEMEGLEFREALKILAEKAGVELKERNFSPEKKEARDRTLEILELATKFYEHQLFESASGKKALEYLKDRGLIDDTIKEFRLGYAPDGWTNILEFLTKRGYSTQEIVKTGLLVEKPENRSQYDRFRDRIMFPILEIQGRVVGYSARVVPGQDESQAKYINTPETDVYHKSRVLFGLSHSKATIKKRDWALLVEGNMDVIAAYQAGFQNVLAVSGTALTPDQVSIIKRYTKNVKMFFDMDSAGENATKKSIRLCLENGMNVKVIQLPSGKDAADIVKDNPEKLLQSAKEALLAMEYFWKKTLSKFDRKTPEGKKKITEEFLEMVSFLESDIEKSHWTAKLSEELQVSEKILTEELKKASVRNRTIQKTFNSSSNEEHIANFNWQDKLTRTRENLIGLALAERSVWEKIGAIPEDLIQELGKDPMFSLLISQGEKCQFNFKNFLPLLSEEEMRRRAESLFVQKKYRLDLSGNPEEIVYADPKGEMEKYLKEARMEIIRRQLLEVADDLGLARKKGDLENEKILREESRRLSEELNKLHIN